MIIFNFILMSKYVKIFAQGIKYSLYFGLATFTGSLFYLQYINYKIGNIEIDRQAMIKYYTDEKKQWKVSQSQAENMYYWLLIDISIMRVLTYHSYAKNCEKINKKIVDFTLKNYDEKKIIKNIENLK